MKKKLSLVVLAMAALGTTLWAQQDDPQPVKLRISAATFDEPQADDSAQPAARTTQPDSRPTSSAVPSQPARANARTTEPGDPSTATGRSGAGGAAYAPRPDLDPRGVYGWIGVPGQGPGQGYAQPPQVPRYSVNAGGTQFMPYVDANGTQLYRPVSDEEQQSAHEFRQTIAALRKAKTDEEKAEVRGKLNDLVSKQIDRDLADREKRLTELEEKAKQLRDQLQQRQQTKAEIQKMLVMLIENPQGGLGLPSSWMSAINENVYAPYAAPGIPTVSGFPANYPNQPAFSTQPSSGYRKPEPGPNDTHQP